MWHYLEILNKYLASKLLDTIAIKQLLWRQLFCLFPMGVFISLNHFLLWYLIKILPKDNGDERVLLMLAQVLN